jgi:hypothetical protein
LLVFLADLAREPLETRKTSSHIEYINQSLEVLEAIEKCSVAQKIGRFVTEFAASLLGDDTASRHFQTDPSLLAVPGLPISDFAAFLSGYAGDYQTDGDTFNCFEQGLQDFMPQQ